MLRYPAVAGQFYPSDPDELRAMVSSYCTGKEERLKARAVVVPHAGYIYSGMVAGQTFGSVEIPPLNVIMGPNHTGFGARASVFPEGSWVTPLGEVPVDKDVAEKLVKSEPFEADVNAHIYEHSLEVQVPFLQVCSGFRDDLKIVPITLGYLSYGECESAGEALASALKGEDALIVISSDFSHYISREDAEKLDSLAIDAILNLSPEELYKRVRGYNITMCGVIPATVGIIALKILGARGAKLINYRTSGDVTGDYSQVVAYAGIVIF